MPNFPGSVSVYDRKGKLISDAKNVIQRQPAQIQQIDQTGNYLPYGINDAFPLKLYKSIQDSVTASACLNSVSKFIRGSALTDTDLMNRVVNSYGETFWEVHTKVSNSYSCFRGFALCVKYNALGEITEFYQVPFQYFRLARPDDNGQISKVVYNPFFGTNEDQTKDNKTYDLFNPKKDVVLSQIARDKSKYKGQILYYGETTPLSPFYPMPIFASAMPWMDIEHAISVFHKENLDNGFFQSVLLRIIGDPTAESTHPDDMPWDEATQTKKSIRTMGERFNLEMQKFSGAERVGNIMVQWAQNKDEFPSVEAFPTNGNQELFTALSTEAIDKIALGFNIPSILANVQRGGTLGGDGNLLRVAVKLMQARVVDDQRIIAQQYAKILFNLSDNPTSTPVTFVNYDPYPELGQVDNNIWQALTLEERRLWIKENTNYKILNTSAPAPQPENKILAVKNAIYTTYPEQAKKNAKTALQYRESKKDCMKKMGWERAEMIANGNPLPYKEIKRIYSFLIKNNWAKDKMMNESCEALQFAGWGGKAMMDWAGQIIKDVEL